MLYSAAMALDGFIARPGGDMSWLTEYLGPNPTVRAVIGEIGALLERISLTHASHATNLWPRVVR
jgi:hypothetical protein